ncbi:testin isoform X2 [Hydra vulgaris]|uniref:Testin isoform X2 n=1 Tax=Hydra vulgaris TaxID=6087 RepID=A0ABM4CZQ0_HYDVU
MDDFIQLEFHNIQQKQGAEKYEKSEFSAVEGVSCLICKEKCPGFCQHSWRRGCGNCKCALWRHDVPQNSPGLPFNRLDVEEINPPLSSEYDIALTEGYNWIPRGLKTLQIESFMRKIPKSKVPKTDSEGARYRARQIFYQLPKQDYNRKYANFLKEDAKPSFDELSKFRLKSALGIGCVKELISKVLPCHNCSININSGEMGVFTERLGESFCWHPQCFKCCVDDELLIDLIYFVHEKKIYCGRHWAEQIKPRCHGCEELIYIGEFTKAMEKSWHVEHFCCWQCDVPITGKKYIIINKRPYCQRCYVKSMANTCFECKQPISPESKDFFVKDRHYHKECLVCSSCKKALESQTFSFVNERPLCHACRGVDPEKSKFCKSCEKPFLPEEKKVGVGENYFHERCFLCTECQKPIGSQKFIRKADGRRLCNDCFETTAKPCFKCKELIRGSSIKFEENMYHTKCFFCENCKKELGGAQFYKYETNPYCDDCFLVNYAKRCASCFGPIEGNTKFIDYESKYWHSKCFICRSCDKQLAGAKFIMRDGNRYCLECK